MVLGVTRKSRGEFEVEFLHGCGCFNGLEMGVEGAEKDIRRERRLGEDEFAGVGSSVVEGKGELDFGGGALMMMETIAEGLQEPFGHEKKGLMALDRRFELMGDAVVVPGAVEREETVMFAVGDVVEPGEFFAEAFGEALSREFGEIGEGLQAPELEDGGVGKREGFGENEVGEFEGEWIGLIWAK